MTDDATNLSVLKILRKAERLLDRGWAQGVLVERKQWDESTCYCLVGAISASVVDYDATGRWNGKHSAASCLSPRDYDQVGHIVRLMGFASIHHAQRFNDRPKRTRAQVVDRVRNTVRELEA